MNLAGAGTELWCLHPGRFYGTKNLSSNLQNPNYLNLFLIYA